MNIDETITANVKVPVPYLNVREYIKACNKSTAELATRLALSVSLREGGMKSFEEKHFLAGFVLLREVRKTRPLVLSDFLYMPMVLLFEKKSVKVAHLVDLTFSAGSVLGETGSIEAGFKEMEEAAMSIESSFDINSEPVMLHAAAMVRTPPLFNFHDDCVRTATIRFLCDVLAHVKHTSIVKGREIEV